MKVSSKLLKGKFAIDTSSHIPVDEVVPNLSQALLPGSEGLVSS